jgi:hypothetical protein
MMALVLATEKRWSGKTGTFVSWDQGFESALLQRRVREPSVPLVISRARCQGTSPRTRVSLLAQQPHLFGQTTADLGVAAIGEPSGVALSIADACREMREHENVDTKKICQDPAIRLMVFQLAHLFGVAGAQYDLVHYIADEAACKERLAEFGLKPFGAG